jgi:hypothetical protein
MLFRISDRHGFKYFNSIVCSNEPIETRKHVSSLPLPNQYAHGRPCYSGSRSRVNQSLEAAVIANYTSYWESSFNGDGYLAGKALWRQIAARGKEIPKDRASVLKIWEQMTLEEVLALKYPRTMKLQTWVEGVYF